MLGRLSALAGSLLILMLAATLAQAVEGDEHWSSAFALPGTEGAVLASLSFQGDLIIGGDFRHVGTLAANRVARWNGSEWSPLGEGFDAPVLALAEFNGELYAGGSFEHSGERMVQFVARWDGSAWQPLSEQLDWYDVRALAVFDGRLVAGGRERGFGAYGEWFEGAGLAAWDGDHWIEVAQFELSTSSAVDALAVIESGMVAAGTFEAMNGDYALNFAVRWDGIDWHPMGEWFRPGPLLVVAGQLLAVSGATIYGWTGQAWMPVTGSAEGGNLSALAFHDGALFGSYRAQSTAGVIRWSGSEWEPVGGIFDRPGGWVAIIELLTSYGGSLLAGGYFSQASGVGIPCFAAWDGAEWREVVPTAGIDDFNGMDGFVYGLGSYAGALVAGGGFNYAWRTQLHGIGLWTGSAWASLGSGVEDSDAVNGAICEYQGQLVVSGSFQQIGGIPTSNMAIWTGSNWQPFGTGTPPFARALLAEGTNLYVGGSFTSAGGVPARRIALWDGGSWFELGVGLDNQVSALAAHANALIAGGDFTADGNGQPLAHVASWDGAIWQPLGGGLDGPVRDLASWRGQLVAGGSFTNADGRPAPYLALWDGDGWQAAPDGPNAPVVQLAVYHDDLIVAGEFTEAGGLLVNGIARWDGEAWTPLGSGLSFLNYYMLNIRGMVALGDELYVAGTFLNAGDKASYGIACWTEDLTSVPEDGAPAATIGVWNLPNPFNPSTEIVFTLPTAAPVTLRIVDASGRLVRTLLAGALRPAGEQRVTWDGHDDAGRRVGSGVYLLSIEADGRTAQRKLVLLK